MSSRIVVGLLFCVVAAGCEKKTATPDGGADMAVVMEDLAPHDGGDPDLVGVVVDMTGQGTPDMAPDDHNLLRMPTTAVPLKTDGGVDYYEMHVKEGQVQVRPGPMTTIWGFEGQWPGPMIKATMGRPVTLKIFNELPVNEAITIHNHGHNVAAQWDGHPSDHPINQGESYEYHYPNVQGGNKGGENYEGAGTYFYHDHAAHLTAQHVYKGMSGPYILQPRPGSAEANLGLPSGAYDVPLLIQDRSFNPDNSLKYVFNIVNGFLGDTVAVNGTVKPYLDVARRKYRLRLVSHCNARRLQLALSVNGIVQNTGINQIASDGGLLPAVVKVANVPLGPAERADVVVDFAKYNIGDVVTLINQDTSAPSLTEIIQFRVTRNELDNSALPTNLDTTFERYDESTKPAPGPSGVTRTRQVYFDIDSQEWRVNGAKYLASEFQYTDTKLGDVEIWELRNTDASSTVAHPFHQHLVEFQILDVCPFVPSTTDMATPSCGMAPTLGQSGWKDTVLVPPNTVMRVKMKFYYNGPDTATHFPSGGAPYVFHCHNLEHEDHSMMLQQKILPAP